MKNHISEQQLDRYFVNPQSLSDGEREGIDAHILECSLCKEQFEKMQAFYREVEREMQSAPTEQDKVFAEKLAAKPRLALPSTALQKVENVIDAYVEVIEPIQRSIMRRFVDYAIQKPLYVGGGALATFALAFAIMLFVPFKDTHPAYARAEKEFLVVYNKDGKELWRKHIGIGYDWETARQYVTGQLENYLTTLDVDNDGKQEVLSTFEWLPDVSQRNTLICYNSDSEERWRYIQHEKPVFGKEQFKTDFVIHQFITGDLDGDSKSDIIILARQETYSPSVFVRLNPDSGTEISKYWHTGSITQVIHADLDNDEIEEIYFGNENNGIQRAILGVLDPRFVAGYSPTDTGHFPQGKTPGVEKYYLTFPRTDLAPFSVIQRNVAQLIKLLPHGVEVYVVEHLADNKTYGPLFQFDNSMLCLRVNEEDLFATLHRQLEAEGKLTKKLDAQYYEDLRKGVQYWDGEKFVNEPTMNKRYLEAVQKP